MRFTLQFEMENEAFENNPAEEAARILRHVAGMLGDDMTETRRKVLDANGNTVGQWEIRQ